MTPYNTCQLCILALVTLVTLVPDVSAHGRMLNPPSRASKWRSGFTVPAKDYNDNQGFCGGLAKQTSQFGGKCGVCGDAWKPIPREHEKGGKFYSNGITKTWKAGQKIQAKIEITANHGGFFEFRLCAYDNPASGDVEKDSSGNFVEITQACLDRHLLKLVNGGYRYKLMKPYPAGVLKVDIPLWLPKGVKCDKCLFQWAYTAGNSWGTSPNGTGCIGCGTQEQFKACADVKIGSNSGANPQPDDTDTDSTTTQCVQYQSTASGSLVSLTFRQKLYHYTLFGFMYIVVKMI